MSTAPPKSRRKKRPANDVPSAFSFLPDELARLAVTLAAALPVLSLDEEVSPEQAESLEAVAWLMVEATVYLRSDRADWPPLKVEAHVLERATRLAVSMRARETIRRRREAKPC